MTKKKSIIIMIALLIIAGAAGIVMYLCSVGKPEKLPKEYVSVSWAQGYADVADITQESDLIALVRVNKLVQTGGEKIPHSIFEVKVLSPIYGCEKDEILKIYMTGGKTDDKIFEVEDDPLMEPGQEFLIFTQKNADGTCTVLGGPQGRLAYENEKLTSIWNTKLPHTRVASVEESKKLTGINVIDESLDSVLEEINQVLTNK